MALEGVGRFVPHLFEGLAALHEALTLGDEAFKFDRSRLAAVLLLLAAALALFVVIKGPEIRLAARWKRDWTASPAGFPCRNFRRDGGPGRPPAAAVVVLPSLGITIACSRRRLKRPARSSSRSAGAPGGGKRRASLVAGSMAARCLGICWDRQRAAPRALPSCPAESTLEMKREQ